jgi:hypothetical protein
VAHVRQNIWDSPNGLRTWTVPSLAAIATAFLLGYLLLGQAIKPPCEVLSQGGGSMVDLKGNISSEVCIGSCFFLSALESREIYVQNKPGAKRAPCIDNKCASSEYEPMFKLFFDLVKRPIILLYLYYTFEDKYSNF